MESLNQVIHYLAFNLTLAVLAPLRYDSFIYWPYLLSSLLLAVVAWHFGHRDSWQNFRDRFFSRKLWWHRSAKADYRLYLVNALILPFLFSLALPDYPQLAEKLLQLTGSAHWPALTVQAWGWKAAFTVLFFIAYDFGRFVAHYALHRVPVLWEFHKVHHSAEVLTPMTAFRVHPVDLWLMAWGSLVFTAPLYLAFNLLAQGQVDVYLFMGLHVFFVLGNLVGNLRHSPAWLSYGPRWGQWLISPAHHIIHHSTEPRHWDKNMGFELAVWDRLFGTLAVPDTREEHFPLGLGGTPDPRWQSVRYMLFAPFAGAWRVLSRSPRADQAAGHEL